MSFTAPDLDSTAHGKLNPVCAFDGQAAEH
ncbi:MAG: hypothetical protein GDYSWBUE_001751 [Candidatus Fervidibacterota bacterium]